MRAAIPALAFVCALAPAGVARALAPTGAEVAIVLPPRAAPSARAAARTLLEELGPRASLRTSTAALDVSSLARTARAWPEPLAVVVDAARARVSVVRAADGTVLSRALDPEVMEGSAYAVSQAALELLEVARELAAQRSPAPRGLDVRLFTSAALSLTASPGHENALLRPSVFLGLELGPAGSPWWLGVAAGARLFGDDDTALVDELVLDYLRNDLVLRARVGRTDRRAVVALGAEAGLSFTHVRVLDAASAVIDDSTRTTGWLGGAFDLRYRIGGGFALAVGGGAAYVLAPGRYFAGERLVLEEGRLRIHGELGLAWIWPE